MFMSSRKPAMKWSSLLNDLKEKVRRSGSSSQQPLSQSYAEAYPPLSPGRGTSSALAGVGGPDFAAQHGGYGSPAASPARGKPDLELQFKNFWEEFCSSSSEKEKEMALNMTVDIFCRLVKQQPSVAQLIPKLVETHIFSFVVGRAFVTDVEKLRIYSKGRSMNVTNIISFFSEVEDGISPGLNFLYAVEVLVAEAIDKQHLLDSGILCCLIHILNALLSSDECKQGKLFVSPEKESGQTFDCDSSQVRRLEIEESIVHIMKALASHPSAATSLIEDDSLQLLFHMVTNGSLSVFAQFRDGLIPLHMIQLHRHAMQILGLLLVNDNGGTATYIHKHHLIKILLSAVKDFNSDKGDPAYTMDIVDLLLECVELSFRPEAGAIRLREDIHNAHGYQFLVQFALTLSRLQKDQTLQLVTTHLLPDEDINKAQTFVTEIQADNLSPQLSPVLSRLLDFLVNLAQTGLPEPTGGRTSKSSQGRTSGHSRGHTSSFDKIDDESWEKGNAKIKDLEAIQMLQDIFLKADNVELQAEVLNRIFKIFSCHFENYKLCQQLRTVPLLIQNMSGFPPYLQDIILKILEYAATVVNFIPEQELLSLCCLLQQPITTNLKYTILAFFVKLLSFDQQYKKVLREVGVLEILLDDLKQHNYFLGEEQQSKIFNTSKMKFNSSSFKKHIDNKDVILSAPKLMASHSGKFLIFEKEGTITIGWDCLFSLLKEAEVNQQSFRSSNGVSTILPFLVSDNHRSGVLRILSCLIIEDSLQDHQNELGALIEILKSGMVSSFSGSQYKLHIDAKCDIFSALWRILGANSSAQKTFGELTGFSLLLTTLHSFHRREYQDGHASLLPQMKVFSFLMRAVTAGVSYNMINRLRLHTVMSSQTFYDLLCESGLLCVECEKEVIQLSLDLALETVLAPSSVLQSENSTSNTSENGSISFFSFSVGPAKLDGVRVYNPSAVSMLIHSLLHFTPKVQLDVLKFIEKLARASHFNQENLTSVGCVGLLLETISPFLEGSSPLLAHSLRIVEVLGAYRLSSSELRILVRYIFQLKKKSSGHLLVDMLAKLIQTEDIRSDEVSLAPFIEMDMSKLGHASIQVSLGERTWPPAAGYSFVCWFQYHNLKSQVREVEQVPKAGYVKRSIFSGQILRLFSVGAVNEENTLYAELCLQDNRVITLATSNICSLSFPAIDMEEGRWHHLAVVHSKPNALAGFFQASVAYLYINGKLMHTGKLGYSPSPFGKSLQVTIGTTHSHAKTSELQWRLRSCYLFEEVLTSGNICLMYILGRGYRGIFQDTDLLRFVPNQACGGGSMATLDSLENVLPSASSVQRLDASNKQGNAMSDASGIVWDLERLMTLSTQLTGKKLIFAFDGTSSEAFRASGTLSLLNLIDPVSAAASPIGGIPRYGRLSGDVYICNQSVIGDIIRTLGGMTVVLALIEIVETTDMLHMALELLACSLHQNPQNVKDMKKLRGYHLLALFLHRRMSLFDMRSLDIFFRIATCEISFSGPQRSLVSQSLSFPAGISPETSLDDISLLKSSDEISSVGSHENIDQFSVQKYSFSYLSELEKTELSEENSNCIVLSNADMVEHVLLDWTLWVTAPVSVQIALLAFLERMVPMQWYRNHNLTLLRQINFVQHLLVILQRGDVEVPVLEKLIALLGVTLEDGFVPSELELVANFVIMTFDPPEASPHIAITREMMGKHVIVRNMLLEMLIDLQVTINAEELLEQWHTIVSSKLITFFLNEAVHPTSMRWIMTLLGVCLVSPTFVLKFRATGDYQGLFHILPSFYDSPEIYYIIFCLILGKDVYPRVPEVRMLDFFALLPSDGTYGELKFVDLLEVVISMAKATFDKVSVQLMLAHQNGNISHSGGRLVADLIEENTDIAGDLQGEALIHKTYAARLMDGDAGAPNTATSILRFMVDLAKTFPPFSGLCRKTEFLESCVDLYFSCVRADCAVKMAKELTIVLPNENMSDDEKENPQNIFCSLPPGNEHSANTSTTMSSFPREQKSTTSEDLQGSQSYLDGATNLDYLKKDDTDTQKTPESQSFIQTSVNSVALDFHNSDFNEILDPIRPTYSVSSPSIYAPYSPNMSENTNTKMTANPGTSPVLALTSLLGSTGSTSDSRTKLNAMSSMRSFSLGEFETSSDVRLNSHGSSFMNTFFPINPKLLLEIDDSGYGGGPCSAGATAVLDFIAEILADIITEQLKATQFVEHILEAVPLYADAESVLVFQGLCLNRLMNFLERRFLRDDEEDETKLDKNRWSVNLDSLCWMIVDRAYMGSFPEPVRVFRILEFLLSMLQLANKDGRIEDAAPPGKGILSMTRGSKLLESYIHAMLKNTNRIIMYCFLPLFLKSIGEDDLLTNLSFQSESGRDLFAKVIQDESAIDIGKILQLMVANKRLVLCPANVDIDLVCCLCVNMIALLNDKRPIAQSLAVDVIKYLLSHRQSAIEDLLVSKPNQGPTLDALHGGFDRLLTGNPSAFFEWLNTSEKTINKVLEHCASIMWVKYVVGSAKFPGMRIKGMEVRRKREIGRKSKEAAKLYMKNWEQINERRDALESLRDVMSAQLRAIRQDKYSWVLHAESEWQTQVQQLVHERGVFPIQHSSLEPEWKLCPIEGPYRMRKKLERCKLVIHTIQNLVTKGFELQDPKHTMETQEHGECMSDSDSGFNFLTDAAHGKLFDSGDYEELIKEDGGFRIENSESARVGWNNDQCSSVHEPSLHSAPEFGAKSSSYSLQMTEGLNARSELGSPRQSSTMKVDDMRTPGYKQEKELLDNGEYLIRPYLEPSEKIRFKYNCERVVGLDKHDGIFLIGNLCLYVIENFYIDDSGCICEKESEDDLSVIDKTLGVKRDVLGSTESDFISSPWNTTVKSFGGRAWAYNGGAWGREKLVRSVNLPHQWHMWKLDFIHELLRRDYQLRPVAIEVFSMDGCNDLLVFHKKEREEVFRNLVSMNIPRNSMLDMTISGTSKQEANDGSRLFKIMAKSFSRRWQNGEISNFQYLMHLNTLAGRGYSDLTQYPVFPWVLADYESENLDFTNPHTFRKLEKPIGCQTQEGEDEFRKRYESWDDPDVPKFHYGSHYSSAGIVLFYLIRLPPFSTENQKLQGGQFDHADRLFNSIRDTWLSAAGKSNTSDVKELIPEFFYLPEFLENRFNLDLGEKQSGQKVDDVILPPWAKGSVREFIRKHREALESDYVSENLHHWIDLIFGYKQRGKAAEEAVNVFYHCTYEGNVDIDSVSDPTMKASILAQINHFGQTPKQLFPKPHVIRQTNKKLLHPLRYCANLVTQQIRKSSSSISQIVTFNEKILIAGANSLLKPVTYSKYISWGFPDRSLRLMSYDQDKLLSTHENLHGGNQIQCAGLSHDGQFLVTGADDGVIAIWRFAKDGVRVDYHLSLERALCAHTSKITCLHVSQPYTLIVTGSEDCSVILWDLANLVFVKQLPLFPAPVSAVHVNELTGEILTAAGILLAVWSINGDCLAVVNTSQLPSDLILSVTSPTHSDWQETNWYVTGHQSGALKVWNMVHCSTDEGSAKSKTPTSGMGGFGSSGSELEYKLILRKVFKYHQHPVRALHLPSDLKQLLSGDESGSLRSWTLPESFRTS